ncbi:MAG: hypothetical protein J7K85_07700 [Anaerolineaceae bacterium]|nr:hypothetical protein [Anaerolineaceae bacterium]
MKENSLIIGIGNYDRQDDGVAWHILCGVAKALGRKIPQDPYEEEFEQTGEKPHLLFTLQIVPEMADLISNYDHVCFVDAHTGAIPTDLQAIEIKPSFQRSPLTHHMTPETVLSLTNTVSGLQPEGYLVSVRGYQFGFDQTLSPKTNELSISAIQEISNWLEL